MIVSIARLFVVFTSHPALPGGLFRAIGNPLNDGTWTYTWQNGRQLKSMSKSGTFAKFVYNENGLRVQKIIQSSETDTTNAVVTKYTLHGENVVHMTQGSNELHFFYDAQNKPAVVVFNGTPYSYVKNLQGDIVAILDSSKNVMVSYVYDAWGRPISCSGTMASTLGKINPFRYRGYVYDEETGLYYLKSRYYIAQYCRFIIGDIGLTPEHGRFGNNLFTYCTNSPVITYDDAGTEYDIVGWGLQVEASAGIAFLSAGGGIEFILFFDTPEAREHGPFVVAYAYTEKNFTAGDFTGQMDALDEIATLLLNSADELALDGANAMTAIATAGLPSNFVSASVSGFAVTASDKFYGQHDYLKEFESMSINAWRLKGSTAWSDTCKTYSLGVSTPSWGVSYSNSYYYLLKTWGGDMCTKCKEGILHDEYYKD